MVKPSLVKHCEWSTLAALTIVKQIPRQVHTPPPNCTKARRNKFTFEELSNPWSAKFEELSFWLDKDSQIGLGKLVNK